MVRYIAPYMLGFYFRQSKFLTKTVLYYYVTFQEENLIMEHRKRRDCGR
jgi:hypothetical protein